jgi:hypothetical protein
MSLAKRCAGSGRRKPGKAEDRADHAHLADGAASHQFGQGLSLRAAPVHEGFHQKDIVAAGRVDHGLGLGGVHADRLFHQDVLAGLGRLEHPFRVQGMDVGHVDGLHLCVCQHRLVGVIMLLY